MSTNENKKNKWCQFNMRDEDFNNEVEENCLGEMKTCPICGKEFLSPPIPGYKVKTSKEKYQGKKLKVNTVLCSYSCYVKANANYFKKPSKFK